MTGSGKTTMATRISIDYNAGLINSDATRKEIMGLDIFERHHDEINQGIYTPSVTEKTYEKLMKKAVYHLRRKRNVVLDATFQKKQKRSYAKKTAQENNAAYIPIECTAKEETIKKWLDERIKKKTITDGRWEVYQSQKKTYEPFTHQEKPIRIDMSNTQEEYLKKVFLEILKRAEDEVL